jgi:hypothetical protein
MAPIVPNRKKIRGFGRARKISAPVAMLERGDTIVPERPRTAP